MKYIIITALLSVLLLSNCSTETKKIESEPKVELQEKTVITVEKQKIKAEFDSSLYELILSDNKTNKNLIVFIDPHGDGKFISDKIKAVSKKFNASVICLNNVENNIPNYIELINKDIENYKKQTNRNVDNLYIVGFSGGARMAFQYANKNKVSGIVMCGAGIGNMINNKLSFPTAFISGTADFNFNEQYYSPFSEAAKNKNILGLNFNGKHEWPSNDLLALSVMFLESKQNTDVLKTLDYSNMMNDYNEYRKHNELYIAFKKIETINKFFDTEQTNTEFNNFISSQSFKDYITKFEISLQIEFDRNNGLASALPSQTWEWWNNKIDEIDNTIKNSTDQLERDSYKRTKAYLGIIMYSMVNKEINKPNSTNIEKYLKIYEKLEPENEDLKKFKEMYEYQNNG